MDLHAAMRAFRRVVDRRSFSLAAEDLGTSRTRLSRQVQALETRLGAALLVRTTRRMSLTEVGAAYHAECVRLLDGIDDLERSVAATSLVPTGLLRVNAPLSYGVVALAPAMAAFASRYPEVRIDLHLSDTVVDLISGGFDVAVRVRAQLEDSSLVARRVAETGQALYAAPAYLDRRSRPASPDDLTVHDHVGYSLSADAGAWPMTGPGGARIVPTDPRFRVDNSLALGEAIAGGLGVGALPRFLAEPLLAAGRLERVLPDWSLEPRAVYLVYPSARHLQPKVRAFVDFMAGALG